MSEIRVEYMTLREKMLLLFELYAKLRDEISKISEYTKDLDIFWDGAANLEYMKTAGEDIAQICIIMTRTRKTVYMLKEAFSLYMANEREVCGIIGSYKFK